MSTKKSKTPSRKILQVSDKFIYCESVYKLWKNGCSLIREKYYSSDTPIELSKSQFMKVYKDYKIVRYFDLESAPIDWSGRKNY